MKRQSNIIFGFSLVFLEDVSVQVKKEVQSPVKPARKALRETQKVQETTQSVRVKREKITDAMPQRESVENMPPPQVLPVKKAIKTERVTRSTRTRTRKQQEEKKEDEETVEQRKDSDVVLEDPPITCIEILSDEEEPKKVVRSTRTRTRTAAKKEEASSSESAKRSRSTSEDSNRSSKQIKKNKKKKETAREKSVYEDAVSETPQKEINKVLNGTYVVKTTDCLKDLMTDDESPVLPESTVKSKGKNNATKVFSAFDHSPVKKKVEAFEKLGAAAAAANNVITPVKQTRTKTRAQAKNQVNKDCFLFSINWFFILVFTQNF